MADPFSVVASTISIADVGIRLATFLVQVKRGSDAIDEDLDRLIREIESFNTTSKLIRESFETDIPGGSDATSKDEEARIGLWRATGNALQDCRRTFSELDALISKVVGDGGSSTFDKLRRYLRRQSKHDELLQLLRRLNRTHELLQILLIAINMLVVLQSGDSMLIISWNIHPKISGNIQPIFQPTIHQSPGFGKRTSDANRFAGRQDKYRSLPSFRNQCKLQRFVTIVALHC